MALHKNTYPTVGHFADLRSLPTLPFRFSETHSPLDHAVLYHFAPYVPCAGLTVWTRLDFDAKMDTELMTVYLSPTPLFIHPSSVQCMPVNFTVPTSQAPYTFMCNRTISNARFITLRRDKITASNPVFQFSEILPLRYGELHSTLYSSSCCLVSRLSCPHRRGASLEGGGRTSHNMRAANMM